MIAERLSDEIRDLTWTIGNDEFSVGVTVGIASSHFLSDATLAQLLEAADRDLYKNKWMRTKSNAARPSMAVDRVLPLPEMVNEIEPKTVEGLKPAPSGSRGKFHEYDR